MIEDESLVSRRPKRSTAGNRMEEALAEIVLEDVPLEVDDDKDFFGQDDEDEVFDSDFQSTDEEVTQDDNFGENAVQEEEQHVRKIALQRVSKAKEIAHFRQRATFNRQHTFIETQTPLKSAKFQRRVSLGAAVNAETGELVGSASKRQSRRKSTMLNTQVTHSRLKVAEERKASNPKKAREVTRRYTQDELIARALDTEEGNIVDHRDYLSQEEEKRRRAKVVRKTISGPVLKWISKVEEAKVEIYPPPQSASATVSGVYGFPPGSYAYISGAANGQYYPSQVTSPSNSNHLGSPQAESMALKYGDSLHPPTINPSTTPLSSYTSRFLGSRSAFSDSSERVDKIAKNYVIHELDQVENTVKPTWDETMEAIFGDHVKWDEVRVFTGKNRPSGHPVLHCPLTGRPAPYRDPRTGVPYANSHAYNILSKVLAHEYTWSNQLGCYTDNPTDFPAADARSQN